MADMDFTIDYSSGSFEITFTDNPKIISANREMLNRFEITLMTNRKMFFTDNGAPVTDDYGGDAMTFMGNPQNASNTQGIAASLAFAVEQTVKSMKEDDIVNDTVPESKIKNAEVLSVGIDQGVVTAVIRVYPEVVQSYGDLDFILPIIGVNNG